MRVSLALVVAGVLVASLMGRAAADEGPYGVGRGSGGNPGWCGYCYANPDLVWGLM